ncbi:ribosome recycling factor protein [Toxoplasma gondii RUB]|uniref:Ribosome recycling factor protein n=3 Tax=Toxoplasma gondii TaxID=5811 RepID=A0A086LP52_TOXGO|nr:ribosome recycling factor protein [Toxoplasma gondii p89]KFG58420.1 ribosome recycling factor protein [Toxoplasma gondii RUB]
MASHMPSPATMSLRPSFSLARGPPASRRSSPSAGSLFSSASSLFSSARFPGAVQRRRLSTLPSRPLPFLSSSFASPSSGRSLSSFFSSPLPFSCPPIAVRLSCPSLLPSSFSAPSSPSSLSSSSAPSSPSPLSSSFSAPASPWRASPSSPAHAVSRRCMASGKKKKGQKSREDGREEDKRMRKVLKVIGGDGDAAFSAADAPRAPRGVGGKAQGLQRARARGLVVREEEGEEDGEEEDEEDEREGRGNGAAEVFSVAAYEADMKAAIDKMVQDISALLVHRERAEHFERIPVSAGGEKRRLSDLAQVVVRGASTVHVHVFSEANLSKVMSALRAADSKWTLQQEGNTAVRLQLPKVTSEMREELKTKARVFLVTAKSAVRNMRQAGRSHLHKLQFKSRSIDDVKRRELDASLTTLMETYVAKCDKVFNEKMQQFLLS